MAYLEVGGEVGQYPKQVVWFYLLVVLAQAETDLLIGLLHLLKALCHPRHLQRRRRVEPLRGKRDSTIRINKICVSGEKVSSMYSHFGLRQKACFCCLLSFCNSQVDSYKLSLLPTGSEEREVLGGGSIPVAILPSRQDMKYIAL